MSYGKLGQQKPGHLKIVSTNPKVEKGGPVPTQTLRGYGGAVSKNSTNRGRPNGEGQHVRGYPITKSKSSRRSGGKGR